MHLDSIKCILYTLRVKTQYLFDLLGITRGWMDLFTSFHEISSNFMRFHQFSHVSVCESTKTPKTPGEISTLNFFTRPFHTDS